MFQIEKQTIAAISTAVSESGIGIIRMSGDQAIEIADKVYRGKHKKRLADQKTYTIHYGYIADHDEIIDEVLVMLMRGPHSYTGEDTIEINCHGGVYVVNRILEVLIKCGARPAEPGEFTERAFLNGRIDLSQAEAVIDIIQSENEYALKSSVNQLRGSVKDKISNIRKKILYHTAFIETALDDPEHISLDGYQEKLAVVINDLLIVLKKLLDRANNGKIIKNGIRTVIIGKPNAGKSSLLNMLVGEEKAIVTNIAGTTRDALEELVQIRGIGLRIIDTAGIRSTEDIVEKIGVEKAVRFAEEADLILYVADSSIPLDENDDKIFSLLRHKNVIVLLNKTDLFTVVTEEILKEKTESLYPIVKVSAVTEEGIDELEETIQKLFFHGKISFENEVYMTNVRHKEAVREAYNSLLMVQESILLGMPEDFYSIDLMNAYTSLGRIIGEEIGEDLINEIFSKFCMGK